MNGNALSIGRNHRTADSVSMQAFSVASFNDTFRLDICWNDGAAISVMYDTRDEAVQHAHRLGWGVSA